MRNPFLVHLFTDPRTLTITSPLRMMSASPLSMMFSSVGIFYALFLPVMAIQLFALLAIPALLRPGLKTFDVGRALFSYTSQTVGILLMSIGGLPTLFSVLTNQALTNGTYTALLIVFAVGGLTYLWHDAALLRLDPAARAVPRMVFACAWKFLGLLIVLLALLSLVLRFAFMGPPLTQNFWIMHLILVFYGVLLTHISIAPAPLRPSHGFQSQAMAGGRAAMKKKKR